MNRLFIMILLVGLGIFVKFVYLFSIGKFDCNCLYYKTLYTSVILLPEDGLWNKSKVLAMNLRTFYLALKFITHLCLLRPFGNIYIYIYIYIP